jgi:hypothetical protein
MKHLMRPYYVQVLSRELAKRKNKNSRYSMRAFANALGLDPSALSRILSLKQELSLQCCIKICQRLHFSEDDKRLFFDSVAQDKTVRTYSILSRALEVPLYPPGMSFDSHETQIIFSRVRDMKEQLRIDEKIQA